MFRTKHPSNIRRNPRFKSTLNRKLRLESLEQKNLLAGDVTASLVGGDLFITGDFEDNWFQVARDESLPSPGIGEVSVNGLSGTTINGLASASFLVTGDIHIDFSEGGDNTAEIGDQSLVGPDPLELPGSIFTDGGAGIDVLSISLSNLGGDVSFDDASGASQGFRTERVNIAGDVRSTTNTDVSDISFSITSIGGSVKLLGESAQSEAFWLIQESTVGEDIRFNSKAASTNTLLDNVAVGDDVVLNTADGDDSQILASITIGDDLFVSTGEGTDEVLVEGATITDKLRINTDGGDDAAFVVEATIGHSAFITLGDGNNASEIQDVDAGHTLTILGHGVNDIFLSGVTTTHFVTIITANGDDVVIMDGVTTHSATVTTKAGMDSVSISNSEFDYLFVLLGSGDDVLELDGVTVDRLAFLNGGGGNDTLVDVEDSNDINFALDIAFEELLT